MMTQTRARGSILGLGLAAALVVAGCTQSTPEAEVPGGAPVGGDMSVGAPVEATPVATGDDKLTDDEVAQINKLPDEADRAAALAQMVCPIGTDIDTNKPNHLGSMGMPIKKVVDGKPYFLCCKGCEADFDKDPQAAIANLATK
jgi:hypothetical protein